MWGFESPGAHVTVLEDMTVEVEHHFDAPVEQVFALLTDVARMAGLGPEHESAAWLDGRRFTGRNRLGDLTWEVTCHVTELDPPRAFAWSVGDPALASSTWRYDLHADGVGTLVRQRFQHGPGMSYLRRRCEQDPAGADGYIAWRADNLRTSMATVLQEAASLLQG